MLRISSVSAEQVAGRLERPPGCIKVSHRSRATAKRHLEKLRSKDSRIDPARARRLDI